MYQQDPTPYVVGLFIFLPVSILILWLVIGLPVQWLVKRRKNRRLMAKVAEAMERARVYQMQNHELAPATGGPERREDYYPETDWAVAKVRNMTQIFVQGTEPGDIEIPAVSNNLSEKLEEIRQRRREYWRLIAILSLIAIGWVLVTYSIAKLFFYAG
jgi:hypothetical protein